MYVHACCIPCSVPKENCFCKEERRLAHFLRYLEGCMYMPVAYHAPFPRKIVFARKRGVSHTSYDILKDVCTCLLHTMLRSQGKLFLQGREAARTLPTISLRMYVHACCIPCPVPLSGKKYFFGRKGGVSHTSYDIFKDVCTCPLHTMLRSQGELFLQGREAPYTLATIPQ